VPILLQNNGFAANFEWVLGMYSYPKYGSFDPTFVMSIFYFIIFGIMFADVGYGLLLVLGCFGGIKLLKPREGMRRFLAMFGYCGISSIVWGLILGAYFGDLPKMFISKMLGLAPPEKVALWFDPIEDPMTFLVLSLAVGAVHLIGGMAVQFYLLCRAGKPLDALMDVGSWWVLFAGIALLVIKPDIGLWVLIAGLACIILTQGRHKKGILGKLFGGVGKLYDLVSYMSDLLSYSRILALGLASAVIAQVVNILGTLNGGTVVGYMMFILVFIIGHGLNLVINVLGTFVHTSRLQYIEFFNKFYVDGGRPFKPAMPADLYTVEPAAAGHEPNETVS
jgi:V/A-type H+-transporting ATPase subunit I